MTKIFICYRHEDSQGSTGRLYDRLKKRFPDRLMDVQFSAGESLDQIFENIERSSAVLVVIGKTWLDLKDRNGRSRLEDPKDWVRCEIRHALRKHVRVIPVLVEGGVMPKREQLPPGLRKLAKYKGVAIRHERFDDDLETLVGELERIITSEETRCRKVQAAASEAYRTLGSPGSPLPPTALDLTVARRTKRPDAVAAVTDLILRYYTPEVLSRAEADFRRFRCEGQLIETTIAARKSWTGLKIPLTGTRECCKLKEFPRQPFGNQGRIDCSRLAEYITRVTHSGSRIWDDYVYRLLDIHVDRCNMEMEATFTFGGFLEHRFSMGLLNEEIDLALEESNGDVARIIADSDRLLPLRDILLPNTDRLFDFQSSLRVGGVQVLFAMATREGDFCFPTNRRGHLVSTGQGRFGSIPMGYHQHGVNAEAEVRLSSTVFREIYEELFGGEEVKRGKGLEHDWFFKHCPALDWLRKHCWVQPSERASYPPVRMECTAIGTNLVHGTYCISVLVVVHDPAFWGDGTKMVCNWEEFDEEIELRSTRSLSDLKALLTRPDWQHSSLVATVEGLLRLHELEPQRVNLPSIERVS